MLFKSRKEYFEHNAVSYSLLKAFDKDPASVLVKEEVSGEAIDFGSAVDNGPEKYAEEFAVITAPKPSASSLVLAEEMIKKEVVDDIDGIADIIKDLGLWSKQKPETRLKNITKDLLLYVEQSIEAKGKTVLLSEDNDRVSEVVHHLRSSHWTRDYFKGSDDVDIWYQFAYAFDAFGIHCKCMLDCVVVNHATKEITPVDLKTTSGDYKSFKFNVLKYRYDLQAALYTLGLEHGVSRSDKFKGYTIKPFMFVVSSKTRIESPHVYMLRPNEFLEKVNAHTSSKYKGLNDIVMDFKKHSATDDWLHDLEMQEKGFIFL
jgi:hypothetical protein